MTYNTCTMDRTTKRIALVAHDKEKAEDTDMLAQAELEACLRDRDPSGPIRDEVVASWRRSLIAGLRPDRLLVPYDGDVDTESHLARTARPVLSHLAADLDGMGTSVVLATVEGRLVERWVPDRTLVDELDAVSLAPGYRYSEEHVGTNAIGMALEQQRPAFVTGPEHFAEALVNMGCAAAPIVDPRTRRVIGVASLVSRAASASPLMVPLAVRAAREIEHRLLQEARAPERALFDHYLRTANRTNRPAVSLNAGTMITNAAAARILQPSDHAVLWELASRALATQRLLTPDVTLATGASVSACCDPVYDGADLIGIAVRLYPLSEKAESSARAATRAAELPGLVGGSDLWRTVCLRAWQAARSTGTVQIVGEPGVGKLAVATALLELIEGSPVRVHDAADVRDHPARWLAEFDRLVDDSSARLVLRHAHLLADTLSYRVGRRLDDIPVDGRAKVVVTGDSTGESEASGWALRCYVADTITVPPLRRRREDIPALFSALASRIGPGERPVPELAPDALRALMAHSWPGNVRQLGVVASQAVRSAAGRTVRLTDLPAWLNGGHPRRPLSLREQLECDAIVAALHATGGNRVHAASRLGMSRSTLYRKLATYGIEPDEFAQDSLHIPRPR
jgi:sigma-54 dependent transcriptional regulator, acetoin dehydrogenase operon transcriptional activator AcoR